MAREIADLHGAALDPDEGSVALVLGQPDRAAHGRRGVLARRTELALAVAPQLAEHGLGALLLVDAAHRARGPRPLALEHDVCGQRTRRLRHRLLDLEDPVVEVGGLRLARL